MRCSAEKKILILGDDDRTVLPVARSLGRRGCEVHLAWYPSGGPAAVSRYVKQRHVIPSFRRGQDAWKSRLRELLEGERFQLVLPVTEHAVYALQRHRADFEAEHAIYLLGADVFETVIDKSKTYQLAQSLSIPCPVSHVVNGELERDLVERLGLPLIIKPQISVDDSEHLSKIFVQKAESWEEASAHVDFLAEQGMPVLLQSCFDGEGVGMALLARRGEVLTAVQHVRLHETNGYGSTYRATVALDERLLNACRLFARSVDYTGIAMVEFRVNKETGDWVLLEVNGRFWGSLPLAVKAGVDFPYLLYQTLTGAQCKFPQGYRVGIRSRALTDDVRWYKRALLGRASRFANEKDANSGWHVNRVSKWQLLASIARGALLLDRIDSFAWDDPAPLLRECRQLFSTLTRRQRATHTSRQEPSTRTASKVQTPAT